MLPPLTVKHCIMTQQLRHVFYFVCYLKAFIPSKVQPDCAYFIMRHNMFVSGLSWSLHRCFHNVSKRLIMFVSWSIDPFCFVFWWRILIMIICSSLWYERDGVSGQSGLLIPAGSTVNKFKILCTFSREIVLSSKLMIWTLLLAERQFSKNGTGQNYAAYVRVYFDNLECIFKSFKSNWTVSSKNVTEKTLEYAECHKQTKN